jgi:hypothetical protein
MDYLGRNVHSYTSLFKSNISSVKCLSDEQLDGTEDLCLS